MALQYFLQGLKSSLTAVASQIFLLRIPYPCTLKEIEISFGSAVPVGQVATFDVNAGASAGEMASVFPVALNRPKASAGEYAAAKVGLNIALAKGYLTVDLDVLPLGGISAPVFLSLTVDDGLPAGVTVTTTEDVPSINVVASKLVFNPADLLALVEPGAVRVFGAADVVLPTELPPSGAAGGDLSGAYPNPTVESVGGKAPGAASGLATLDAGGLLPTSQLPALALNSRTVVASQAAMLALTSSDVQPGDFAFRTDSSEVYLLVGDDPSSLASWVIWLHPAMPTTLPPTGAAGGDLGGAYPNPSVLKLNGDALPALAVAHGFLKRTAAGTAFELVGFGNTANSVTQGNDARLSDSRAPSGAAGGDLSGTFPNPGVDGLRGRSLGGIPSTGGVLEDDFSTGVVDTGLWSTAATQHDGAMYFVNGGWTQSNIGNPNFTDKFVSFRLHPTAQTVFRIHNGTLDGDTYIQIWWRPGEDIRFGKREAGNSTWITGFGNDEHAYVEADFAFVKVAHSTATGKVHFYRSPDGTPGSWIELGSYAPSVAVTAVYVQWIDLGGGGNTYIDTFRSDLPVADPIAGKNYFGLLWDNPNNQFSIIRALGVVPLTTGAPAGAPSSVPAGHTLLMYDAGAHILYAWNGSGWDSQAF